jgi:hypothetical protein
MNKTTTKSTTTEQEIKESINKAVQKNEQPEAVAEKLHKWFDEVVRGNEHIDNREAVYRRLDTICAAITVNLSDED